MRIPFKMAKTSIIFCHLSVQFTYWKLFSCAQRHMTNRPRNRRINMYLQYGKETHTYTCIYCNIQYQPRHRSRFYRESNKMIPFIFRFYYGFVFGMRRATCVFDPSLKLLTARVDNKARVCMYVYIYYLICYKILEKINTNILSNKTIHANT